MVAAIGGSAVRRFGVEARVFWRLGRLHAHPDRAHPGRAFDHDPRGAR